VALAHRSDDLPLRGGGSEAKVGFELFSGQISELGGAKNSRALKSISTVSLSQIVLENEQV
jgi:hypothetical protein